MFVFGVFAACSSSIEGGQANSGRGGGDAGTREDADIPLVPAVGKPADSSETGTAADTDRGAKSPPITIAGGVDRALLRTDGEGSVIVQLTPLALQNRALPTLDTFPSSATHEPVRTIGPLAGEPLARSTWNENCPVTVEELSYLTMPFVGFDGKTHVGEMIVHAEHAGAIAEAFAQLFSAQYPIEEMRIVESADLLPPSDGDANNTTAFVCRTVAGTSTFSEHAYGLAIDINPFQNPYVRRTEVIPPLATAYADRSWERPGMISEGDPVVQAFDAIGWQWGGRWNSLKDYQHFSLNGR